jgi:hypothetical protein
LLRKKKNSTLESFREKGNKRKVNFFSVFEKLTVFWFLTKTTLRIAFLSKTKDFRKESNVCTNEVSVKSGKDNSFTFTVKDFIFGLFEKGKHFSSKNQVFVTRNASPLHTL